MCHVNRNGPADTPAVPNYRTDRIAISIGGRSTAITTALPGMGQVSGFMAVARGRRQASDNFNGSHCARSV